MIQKIGQVMLYVNDPQKVASFWTEKLNFQLIHSQNEGGVIQIEIAPNADSQTHFVLFERAVIEKMEPELNFGTPSIMFEGTDIKALYEDLKNQGITVGDLVEMPFGLVFNFADPEGNYFAITEKKS